MVDKGKLASVHKRKICQFYQKSKKCTNLDFCIEQLLSDPSVCTSNLYYCMDLEQQLKPFQDEYFKDLDTSVIAELAKKSNNLTSENRNLKKALEEIKKLTGKIISNDDQPACVMDTECPLNGGVGFDNHCDENCPFISAKKIMDVIEKVEGEK